MGYPERNVSCRFKTMPLQEIQRIVKRMWSKSALQQPALGQSTVNPELVEAIASQQAQQEQQLHLLENRITQLEASSHITDPWVRFAGMFKDDPLFDEFVEDMAAYRRELDAEVAMYELKEPSA
jgi:hypothetical protein